MFFSTLSQAFASTVQNPSALKLELYHHNNTTKNGRQFRENAWEEHDGRHILMLVASKDQLLSSKDIHAGTPVLASFDSSDKYSLSVNDTHDLDNNRLVICIDTEDALNTDPKRSYNISLDFYTDDLSAMTYTSKIKNVPAEDIALIPQTGDNAISFVFIAVVSLILMTFILAPKRSKIY